VAQGVGAPRTSGRLSGAEARRAVRDALAVVAGSAQKRTQDARCGGSGHGPQLQDLARPKQPRSRRPGTPRGTEGTSESVLARSLSLVLRVEVAVDRL
jgi:hypothetical protein